MRKRLIITAALAATLMGCAGQETQSSSSAAIETTKETLMDTTAETAMEIIETTDTEETTEMVTTKSESEFAAGATVEDEQNDKEKIELLEGIEEKCPAAAYNRREGVTYSAPKHITYQSTTCGMERGASIILPADYSEDKLYPVLYMLHGIFGNEYSFTSDSNNRINEIITNMAADGYIEDTIIVFPNIYATTDPKLQPGFTAESILPYDNFVNDLVDDLMPYMAENYSILTDREHTYLAGFSMGGRETLYISVCHPELFAYVCAISPAPGLTPGKDWAMEHVGSIQEDEFKFVEGAVIPETFMICCGTNDSVVGTFPLSYHNILTTNEVDHIWYEIPGADHDNNAIRSGIYNLFKTIAQK